MPVSRTFAYGLNNQSISLPYFLKHSRYVFIFKILQEREKPF